jgi:hypothetical protein
VRRATGLAVVERTTVSEGLRALADEYLEDWDGDFGSEDDDDL